MSGSGSVGHRGKILEDLVAFLEWVNRSRRKGAGAVEKTEVLERAADILFGCSERLAVYGSLRPGKENHALLEPLRGEWTAGFVRGRLRQAGWGAEMGYPAMKWDPGGEAVEVGLFASPDLPGHWERLDRFEGEAYERILVPVEDDGGELVAVANLYAWAGAGRPGGEGVP